VRSASEVEQNIVSVERMLQYIELKPEAPYEIPEAQPEGAWPTEGRVEFRCLLLERQCTTIIYNLLPGITRSDIGPSWIWYSKIFQ
jgi:hypothetical protein